MDARADMPSRIAGYDVILELASGGMATTYLARRAGLAGVERLVVLKRVHRHLAEQREILDMLRDEARLAALIRHPHVVSVEDVIGAGGEALLVMPYVEAVPLAALIAGAEAAGERLPPGVVSRVMVDVLSGLHAAHEARDLQGRPLEVVHRDLGPRNILVGADGRSVLIDFGIAKAARRATSTRTGVLKGTFSYMSPEQLRSGRDVDRRADVFAAGAVLHEALTGARLFDGDDEASVLLGILADEIAEPSARGAAVPQEVDRIVLRALERDREERFPTAADLLEALERALPPAPAREVAAWVERCAGPVLAARREAVRAWLEREPAAPAEAPPPAGPTQTPLPVKREADAAVPGITTLASPPRGPRRSIGAVLAAGVVASAALAGGLALALRGGSAPAPSASFAADPPAPPPPSSSAPPIVAPLSSASPAPPAVVELRIEAEAPLRAVSAPGLSQVDLEGRAARIQVAPWSGTLLVEVSFAAGGAAIARFEQEGPRVVKVAAPPSSAPPPRRPELHANPYR